MVIDVYEFVAVVEDHDQSRLVVGDRQNDEAWLSVALVDGQVPNFGDPATWARLRGRKQRRRRSGYRIR